jgi:hypothetical protein
MVSAIVRGSSAFTEKANTSIMPNNRHITIGLKANLGVFMRALLKLKCNDLGRNDAL